MLSSKEALEKVIDDISLEWGYEGIEDELREKLKPLYEDLNRLEELEIENDELKRINGAYQESNIVFQDLIKKLKKAIDILKNKKVNLFHIWVFDDYKQYKEHYPFAEYNAEEDMLAFEEFDLLKGILNDEQ